MWARVMATMSTCPSATARPAVLRSVTRWAWKMGMSTSRLMALARNRKGATGNDMLGSTIGVGQMVARLPAQHVGEVDQAAFRIGAGDGDAVLVGQAVVDQLVARHAHADDVVVADRLAAGFQHLDAEAHPVFQAAAVLVGALVDGRAPELVDQVAVGGGQLEPVQAAFLAAAGGGGVVGDDAAEVGVFHLLRDGAAGRLALW